MKFMYDFGLITGRDPKNKYHPLTDVIHKVLNDLTVDDWSIIIGGDSHTRMSKGVAFGADSGTVALALATGEVTMPIPESVKVTFKGKMSEHLDFRDVVPATQSHMLKQFCLLHLMVLNLYSYYFSSHVTLYKKVWGGKTSPNKFLA